MTDLDIEKHFADLERATRDVFRNYAQHAPNPAYAFAVTDWLRVKIEMETAWKTRGPSLVVFDVR